ncbi:MAG: NUDIX domain-containing protein [Gammaproteobacteria bacterium]|nr:MAG: NUDIX domain-containing protein [Gammaproteobacteria bacterium]
MAKPVILVVAAALYDRSGRVLIAQRPAGKPLAGRWEFPGGKVAAGESEHAAWVIERFTGTPRPLDRQRLKWVAPGRLAQEDLLEADRPFVEALRDLPAPG